VRIYGVDFTCAPRRAKPITVAVGSLKYRVLEVKDVEKLETFIEFEELLARPGPWSAASTFRSACRASWCATSRGQRLASARAPLRGDAAPGVPEVLDAYRNTRAAGRRYAHRATDLPAGSSSPMKLVNPPVALMFHEGAPRFSPPGLTCLRCSRGLEARGARGVSGLLVRKQLGIRESYKSDTRSEQTPARAAARRRIVRALKAGRPLGVRLKTRVALAADGSGDTLDAVICAVQAAWAAARPGYGLPQDVPHAEGWIVTA
jgi:hypothetical protein